MQHCQSFFQYVSEQGAPHGFTFDIVYHDGPPYSGANETNRPYVAPTPSPAASAAPESRSSRMVDVEAQGTAIVGSGYRV